MEKANKTILLRILTVVFFIFFSALSLTSIFCQSITEGFRARKMDGETIKWELEADSARLEENLKTLKGVKVKFYNKDKKPFTIAADNGVVKENVPSDNKTLKRDEIYLEKNVQVTGYLNSTIKCDSLSWDSVSEIMHSQDGVEIEGEKWNIKGEGIEFSPHGDIITIKKDVTMEIAEQ